MIKNELFLYQLKPGESLVIYQAPPKEKFLLNKIKKHLGGVFLLVGILGFASLLGPMLLAEVNYRLFLVRHLPTPKVSLFGQLLWLYDQDLNSPVDWQFGLLIPKIGVNTKIIAQVDPGKPKDYEEALKGGVAQAKNTAFPGQEGTVYLFGHSSAFFWSPGASNRVFALLPKLKEGDQIILFFEGRRFVYQVVEKKITSPSDVAYFLSLPGQKRLVLQTCWPLGTDWQRYVVVAQIQEEEKGDVL